MSQEADMSNLTTAFWKHTFREVGVDRDSKHTSFDTKTSHGRDFIGKELGWTSLCCRQFNVHFRISHKKPGLMHWHWHRFNIADLQAESLYFVINKTVTMQRFQLTWPAHVHNVHAWLPAWVSIKKRLSYLAVHTEHAGSTGNAGASTILRLWVLSGLFWKRWHSNLTSNLGRSVCKNCKYFLSRINRSVFATTALC